MRFFARPATDLRRLTGWPALAALLAVVIVHGRVSPVRADGELVVKARARLTDLETVARGTRVEVAGTLRDNLGQPVARERLEIRLDDAPPALATSDASGRFLVRLVARAEGARTVHVRFPGSALLGAAEAGGQVTVGRTSVSLTFDAPSEVEAALPLAFEVRATDSGGVPQTALAVKLTVDGTDLPPTTTGPDGRARWALRPLSRGRHLLVATAAADDLHLGATASHTVTIWSPLALTLDPLPERLAPGESLVADGSLEGAEGESVPIVLTIDGEPLGGTSTAAGGTWRITVSGAVLPVGRIEVRAMAAPTTPGFRPTFSERQFVEVLAPPPPSVAWVLVPVCLGAVAAGLAGWRRRAPAVRPATAPDGSGAVSPPAFARAAATPDPALRVEVRDAVTLKPVPGAVCRLLGGPADGPEVSVTADDVGRARLSGIGETLAVDAEGYAPARHACPVPPGGAVVVHLLTRRARIQACHEELLRVAGRPILRFGRETPAQSAHALRERGAPGDLVDAFTAAVERGCFGPAEPGPEDLSAVEAAGDALRTFFDSTSPAARRGARA